MGTPQSQGQTVAGSHSGLTGLQGKMSRARQVPGPVPSGWACLGVSLLPCVSAEAASLSRFPSRLSPAGPEPGNEWESYYPRETEQISQRKCHQLLPEAAGVAVPLKPMTERDRP